MSALHEIGIKTFENGRKLIVKLDRKYLTGGPSKCLQPGGSLGLASSLLLLIMIIIIILSKDSYLL